MVITKDKVAAVVLFAVVAVLAATLFPAWGVPGFAVLMALLVSVLGVTLVWFAEPLAETGCFSRGVALSSPPLLIEAIGWLFLIGYPALLVVLIRTAPAWAH